MKSVLIGGIILLLSVVTSGHASTPTETLEKAINNIIAVAADKTTDDEFKKEKLAEVLSRELDFEAVSKRVVSKSWKKATVEQKEQFKMLFLKVMTNTYYALLKNYNNEKVLFLKEQLKKTKKNEYAIVDTSIISGNKKIPVRYRLIKVGEEWKIYDFVPEGISLVTTYKKNYASIIKKSGLDGLLIEMAQVGK